MGEPTVRSVSILSIQNVNVSGSSSIRSIFDSSFPSVSSMVLAGEILVALTACWQVSKDGVQKIAGNCVFISEKQHPM